MGTKRRKFDEDFKSEAVRLVREQGRTVADVSRSLGVHVNTLHTWVKEGPAAAAGGVRRVHRNAESEQVRRLERELREAREERDILKKAVAFFASHRK